MKEKTNLGSYDFIEMCAKITTVLIIIAAICIFAAGIIYSYLIAWWYFIIIYLIGGFALVCGYFFSMLMISLCHDVYMIKRHLENSDNKPNTKELTLGKKTPVTTIKKENTNILKTSNQSFINSVECPVCLTQNSPSATKCSKCGSPLK